MRFKKGDKIRVKKSVDRQGLEKLAISSFDFAQTGTFIRYRWSERADCADVVIRVRASEYYVPETWIELERRLQKGHHLTSIFKDEFVCSK